MIGWSTTLVRKPGWVWLVVVAGALAIFFFDSREPLGIAGSTLYIGIMFVAYWLRDQFILTMVGIGLTLLVLAGHLVSTDVFSWVSVVNRVLAVAGIWLTFVFVAALLHSDNVRQASDANFRNVVEHSIQGLIGVWVWYGKSKSLI